MELTRQEFQEFIEKNNYESYTAEQVQAFCKDVLQKSLDPKEKENAAIDFASLSSVTVRNNDLSKSIMYYRPASIEWREIDEGPNALMKSRQGYYRDTPANRRKGIVGKPYGDPKAESFNEAPRANSIARLKADYAAAAKKGDKATMAKIGAQLKNLSEKEGKISHEKD